MAICSKVSCDFVEKLFEQKRGGLFQFRKYDDQAVSSYYDEVINIDGEDKNIDYLEFVVEETPEKSVQIFNQIPILFQSNRGLNIDNQIKKLKADLENKKIAQQEVLDKQNAQKASLQAAQAEQQNLYNQTKGEEAAYQQLIASSRQAMADAAAAQQAYLASLGGSAGSGVVGDFIWQNLYPSDGAGGCSGGYPYCQEQDTVVDQWQLYNRECVSYAAWAIYYRFGKYVSPFYGNGHAYQWEWSAPAYSGAWRVYDPQPGDAIVIPQSAFAPLGHLMVVESYSDGWIHLSQYNMFGTGQYSTMDIRNSGIILLRFPNR